MASLHKRFFLVSSAFQLSALRVLADERLPEGRSEAGVHTVVLVMHEKLDDKFVALMRKICDQYNWRLVDMRKEFREFLDEIRFLPGTTFQKIKQLYTRRNHVDRIKQKIEEVRAKVYQQCGTEFDEIYTRQWHAMVEGFIFRFVYQNEKCQMYAVPDTLFDAGTRFKMLSKMALLHWRVRLLKHRIKTNIVMFSRSMFNFEYWDLLSFLFHLDSPRVTLNLYEISGDNRKLLALGEAVGKYEFVDPVPEKYKMVVLGTGHGRKGDQPWSFYIDVYNNIIDYSKQKFGIQPSEIIFKHHPRVHFDEWKYFAERLNCDVYEHKNASIMEYQMGKSPHVEIIASCFSDGLASCKLVHNSNAIWFNLSDTIYHQSWPKITDMNRITGVKSIMYKDVCKELGDKVHKNSDIKLEVNTSP